MTDTPTVAVVGTGVMGAPMAENMLAAGLHVRAWNRSGDKAEPLRRRGATVCGTAAEAVHGADLVVTMLTDGPTIAGVLDDDVLARLGDAVWIQMSTVGLDWTERLASSAERAGIHFVDAPVLGTKQPAEQANLIVLGSGPEHLWQRCAAVFDVVGSRTMWVGPVGAGSKLKLVTNAWVLALTNATAESVSLAEQLDLDPDTFLDAISGGLLDVPYAHIKGRAMRAREFPVSFAARHAAKDAELMLDAAQDGPDLAGARAALTHLRDTIERGHGDEDMAALYYGCVG